jgi:hypothetical protein
MSHSRHTPDDPINDLETIPPHLDVSESTMMNPDVDIASLPTIYPSSSSHDLSLNTANATAYTLGLTDELQVAVELESLSLIQDQAPPRDLSGPLLLCQDRERLILIAYQDDKPRQNPWAFTPAHLKEVSSEGHTLKLSLQGKRQMIARLGSSEEAQALADHLELWRHSH